MHPAMMQWWRARHAENEGCGAEAGCGPGGWSGRGARRVGREEEQDFSGGDDGLGGGAFGVRRPLRFLAHKLELDQRQVDELARILSELKTERAQGEVDGRRALIAFADAVGGVTFDAERAAEAGRIRVASAERLRDAVGKALAGIHALLDEDQRARLGYMIRTGILQV